MREQFTRMFEPYGFDANRDIAGIIANRQGHAYFVGGTRAAQQALAMS